MFIIGERINGILDAAVGDASNAKLMAIIATVQGITSLNSYCDGYVDIYRKQK